MARLVVRPARLQAGRGASQGSRRRSTRCSGSSGWARVSTRTTSPSSLFMDAPSSSWRGTISTTRACTNSVWRAWGTTFPCRPSGSCGTVLSLGPTREARGYACLGLARYLATKRAVAQDPWFDRPAKWPFDSYSVARLQPSFFEYIHGADPQTTFDESEQLFERAIAEFGDLKSPRGAQPWPKSRNPVSTSFAICLWAGSRRRSQGRMSRAPRSS